MTEDFRHGIDWKMACHQVPTDEYAIEGRDLSDTGGVEESLDNFLYHLEGMSFLSWEAVIREEQDLPLSEVHEKVLGELINFGDDEDILYIDDWARPNEPWYETLNRIVRHLLVERFDTARSHFEVTTGGWPNLIKALAEHGQLLSLPEGVSDPLDVVSSDLQHRLWLQSCFEAVDGIGSEWGSFEREEDRDRVDAFIVLLRVCKENVKALELTLEKLLKVLIMPPRERELFVELFSEALGLRSDTDPIADHL